MTPAVQHIYQHLVCIFITTPALKIEVVLFAHSCGGRYTNENEDISFKGGIHVPKWMFFLEIFQTSLYTPPQHLSSILPLVSTILRAFWVPFWGPGNGEIGHSTDLEVSFWYRNIVIFDIKNC